jgi:NADH:ubiquinone reductase (non-electrogenic)
VRTAGTQFYEASCTDVDFETKEIVCKGINNEAPFRVGYDKLVVACGAVSNTFNIPGVKENAFFLKDVTHARKIRQRLLQCRSVCS